MTTPAVPPAVVARRERAMTKGRSISCFTQERLSRRPKHNAPFIGTNSLKPISRIPKKRSPTKSLPSPPVHGSCTSSSTTTTTGRKIGSCLIPAISSVFSVLWRSKAGKPTAAISISSIVIKRHPHPVAVRHPSPCGARKASLLPRGENRGGAEWSHVQRGGTFDIFLGWRSMGCLRRWIWTVLGRGARRMMYPSGILRN